mgnify:CR=1 FL=1
MTDISIIIPFFGKEGRIDSLLENLQSQSQALEEEVEIIIVDNNEVPILKERKGVALFHEPIPGSYAARNRGVDQAKGKFLFFTDSDCCPHESWLREGLKEIKERGGIVAGHIELKYEKATPKPLELYERVFYFQQSNYIKEESYGATANLIVEREVFKRHGKFDSALRSGGDQEFCKRMVSCGVGLSYAKKVIVFHPTRSEWIPFLVRRVRALSGNIFLLYRTEGFTWQQLREKLPYYYDQDKMKTWNGDWDFYNSLSEKEQLSIRRCHRVLTIVDMLVLFSSKFSYKLMKKLTMIDRMIH